MWHRELSQLTCRLVRGFPVVGRMHSKQHGWARPAEWTSLGAVIFLLVGMVLTFTAVAVIAAPAAQAAVSGAPKVPQPPTAIYKENFENTGATPVLLDA